MKRFLFLTLMVAVLAPALAQGQSTGLPPLNPAEWFTSTAALAAVVLFLVNFLKARIPAIQGWGTVVASFVVSLGLAFWGSTQGYLQGNWVQFGVLAALTASGLADTLNRFRSQERQRQVQEQLDSIKTRLNATKGQ